MIEDQVHSVLGLLNRLKQYIHHRRPSDALTRVEFMILLTLDHTDKPRGYTVSGLATELVMSNAAMSKQLRIMEGKGLINRSIDDDNRRVVHITISPQGRAIVADAGRQVQSDTLEILNRLGEEDTAVLVDILEKVARIMEERHMQEDDQ